MQKNKITTKYDVIFLMAATVNIKKYKQRLSFFKKYGLMNMGNISCKLILLLNSGDEYAASFFENWGYDVEIIKTDYKHPCPKIYSFFGEIQERYIKQVRWLIKIDDDSLTNVKDLVEAIDISFNYEEPVYLLPTELYYDMYTPFAKLFKKHKMHNYLSLNKWIREREISIMSQASLKKLSIFQKSLDFLQEAATMGGVGHSDDLLCGAFYEAGSKLFFSRFASWESEWQKFIDKKYYHIHFIYKLPENFIGKITEELYAKIMCARISRSFYR